MRRRITYITPLLAAAAAAVAIVAAPTAMAADAANPCTNGVCPNSHTSLPSNGPLPGNTQINDSSGPVQYSPQYPYDEGGDFGGYGGYGGYGHGGFGGGFGGHGGGGGHGK
jgi:opacity protein-like surface antigen